MNSVEPFRQPTPGHSQIVAGGLKVTFQGSSETRGEVVFTKIKRDAKKSG